MNLLSHAHNCPLHLTYQPIPGEQLSLSEGGQEGNCHLLNRPHHSRPRQDSTLQSSDNEADIYLLNTKKWLVY